MSFPDTRDLQQRWLNPRPTIREVAVLTLILSLMGIIFVFDILTPPDDVTICFIYAVLVFLTLFSHGHAVYLCAAIATCLSVLGSFINPPTEAHSMVFFANRGIAIMAQWIVAFLVMTRKDAEMRMREDFDDQRLKAETSRRFLDVLSHEIGTSLTRIDGQAFLLRKNAQTIVQQIQLGSEAGERAMDMTPSAVDLQGLIADIALNSGTDEVTIEIDLTELPPTVWGDSDMLRQVFDNILSNAVKYSPPGGAIRVHGAAEDRVAIVTVIDHGRGIPDDEQAQIFTPYYRARNSRGVHGAGIGLYVARRFVDSHGGSIVIDSRLNAGTTVVIRLPIEPVSSEEFSVPIAHPLH
jgi:signal transduction histidine kinase